MAGILTNRATLEVGGVASAFDIGGRHALRNELEHLAREIDFVPLFDELGKCDTEIGHRGFFRSLFFRKNNFRREPR